MKKIIIFGAGGNGKNIRYRLDDMKYEIVAYFDNNISGGGVDGLEVKSVKEIDKYAYDYIILSMLKNGEEVEKQLIEQGIPQEKILHYEEDVCRNEQCTVHLQEERLAVMRMCISTIKERKVLGQIAEVGVYKGDFAQYLNKYFSDRKLYLFDTFEGMSENTEVYNVTKGKSFSDTSLETVLKKMYYPDQCIIRKGYFPETTENIEDNFAFVSLDTDLYDSILAGLDFFYPRLNKGGYIFVHDYWPNTWKGVKKAVLEYCNRKDIGYVPINDLCGSIIITK